MYRLSAIRIRQLPIWLLLAGLLVTGLLYPKPPQPTPTPSDHSQFQLPLFFTSNYKQTDQSVYFQAHSPAGALFFTPDRVLLTLPAKEEEEPVMLTMQFVAPSSQVILSGGEPGEGRVSYFLGNDPARWQSGLPAYAGLHYQDLYPGIDLHYSGQGQLTQPTLILKGAYTVTPGADPAQIRWRYPGAATVRVNQASGDLHVRTTGGRPIELIEQAPLAWQTLNGERVPIPVRYQVDSSETVGFTLPQGYNPAQPLIIDPALTYATYLGGSNGDTGNDVAIGADGAIYLAGYTTSTDFPTVNPLQPTAQAWDAFIVKFSPDGSSLLYATYLGGSNLDSARSLAVDAAGQAYLTGQTSSGDFPTVDPVQSTFGGGFPGGGDAFIAKLSASGDALLYATYLGGDDDDMGYAIALDSANQPLVTGYTNSANFPAANPIQPGFTGSIGDAFVTTLVQAGDVYTWGLSTHLGGSDWDEGHGLTVDAAGTIYLTGNTRSVDFPTTNPLQPALGGTTTFGRGDAFVTALARAGQSYTQTFSTYLGGSGNDNGQAIAVAADGTLYLTGDTASTDFPTSTPIQPTFGGNQDAFAATLVPAGAGYSWGFSTYLGGEETDMGRDVAVDAAGRIYLTGYTFSAAFPTTPDALDPTCGADGLCGGGGDAFLVRLPPDGASLDYATYLGGTSTDFAEALALTEDAVYLTGHTYATDFPVTSDAYDPGCGLDGACDGFLTDVFLAKISLEPELALTKTADPPAGTPLEPGQTVTYTLVLANNGPALGATLLSDPLPADTAYVAGSLTTTMGQPQADQSGIAVSLDALPAGTTVTATFRVTIATELSTVISNRARVTSGDWLSESQLVQHPVQGTQPPPLVYLPQIANAPRDLVPGCAPYRVGAVQVGDSPRGLALDPGRNLAFVANYGSGSLSVVDTAQQVVIATVDNLPGANMVAFDPNRNMLWVSQFDHDQVTPIQISAAAALTPRTPIPVGDGPWGVAYDPVYDLVYVVNHLGDSLTVIDAGSRTVLNTLDTGFDQPYHLAVNPTNGRTYVANFGDNSVTVVTGSAIGSANNPGGQIVANYSLFDSTQPYGVTVDETRNLIYVSTVDSHRIVTIGPSPEQPGQEVVLGWVAFRRGFGDPSRPVPLRAIAVNPAIGPAGDGGHLWLATTTADGSEISQALLVPKGWPAGFNYPSPYDLSLQPQSTIAIDRLRNRVYLTSGDQTPGMVTILGDNTDVCLVPFREERIRPTLNRAGGD